MRASESAAVAASREWTDDDGSRQPGGEVHAWICPRCTAATGGRRDERWTRVSPRP
ncbi:hypothetical protein [Micromonospora pisi]|uniref:hypothetical protein n=1 Tax=Micromonospora pisi TaxID=589240 RepID=UPI0014773308|nr:hypothetical protein [Micromonospora pisi]